MRVVVVPTVIIRVRMVLRVCTRRRWTGRRGSIRRRYAGVSLSLTSIPIQIHHVFHSPRKEGTHTSPAHREHGDTRARRSPIVFLISPHPSSTRGNPDPRPPKVGIPLHKTETADARVRRPHGAQRRKFDAAASPIVRCVVTRAQERKSAL
jgi:hypothetical protein